MTKRLFKDFLKEQDKGVNELAREIIRNGGDISPQAVARWFNGESVPKKSSEIRAIVEKIFDIKLSSFDKKDGHMRRQISVLDDRATLVIERLERIKAWQHGNGEIVTDLMTFKVGDDGTITIKKK